MIVAFVSTAENVMTWIALNAQAITDVSAILTAAPLILARQIAENAYACALAATAATGHAPAAVVNVGVKVHVTAIAARIATESVNAIAAKAFVTVAPAVRDVLAIVA